ncbi:nitroreductase [Desulfocucumis palustris]|uniref:Nitroreductase n=1 Tax=Desulfocucumis palustris TaxID=1898651 RepID=A0A2L2XGT9_9FIRM|nr:nitroreductase [Desulfocucumis palustris]GBF34933.1 nitroreductase [Desulfocucumis palustris]
MKLEEAIRKRRSVRKYKAARLTVQTVRELLELAACAPSASNGQPWVFVVVEDRDYLQSLSDRAKTFWLEYMQDAPAMKRYRKVLSSPEFNVFYNAPVLVLIYGDSNVRTFICDCSLAAQNLMLAAWDRGIGSCWIGFADHIANTPEVKAELKVPEKYELVAPIILGYPDGACERRGVRKEVQVINWKYPHR